MSIFENINPFCSEIKQRAALLEKENLRLKQQLDTKQQQINDVNKYWKKKLHEQKRKVKHVRLQTN